MRGPRVRFAVSEGSRSWPDSSASRDRDITNSVAVKGDYGERGSWRAFRNLSSLVLVCMISLDSPIESRIAFVASIGVD